MDVLDTNVWVFALTGQNEVAFELVDDVINAERETVVDTYIFLEVICAFSRSKAVSNKQVRETQDRFGELIWGDCDSIENSVDENIVNRYDSNPKEFLESRRDSTYDNMLGDACGIQTKDAPILKLAYEYASSTKTVTIHTNDEDFSEFDPSSLNRSIEMNYVPDPTNAGEPRFTDG